MRPTTKIKQFKGLVLLLVLLLVVEIVPAFELSETNSLKRFAVTCGSALLEGILGLTPEKDTLFWSRCRHEPVPVGCEPSCGGVKLSPKASHERIRACWLCSRWRVSVFGTESPWTWSPMLIAACEKLGYGPHDGLVKLFTDPGELYSVALHSTVPALIKDDGARGGGGGGAGIELWCGDERIVWMGGGGGGGKSNYSRGRGTGGGLQTSMGWSLGAGGGGGVIETKMNKSDELRKQSFTFGYEKDQMENGMREGTSDDVAELRSKIRKCYFEGHNFTAKGSGGSGGSDGLSSNMRFNLTSCDYQSE